MSFDEIISVQVLHMHVSIYCREFIRRSGIIVRLSLRVSDNLRVCEMRTRQQGYHGLSVLLRHWTWTSAKRNITISITLTAHTLRMYDENAYSSSCTAFNLVRAPSRFLFLHFNQLQSI